MKTRTITVFVAEKVRIKSSAPERYNDHSAIPIGKNVILKLKLSYSFVSYEEEYQKLLNLNLDPLAQYIPAFYSNGERLATHQAHILRSLILFVLLFNETKAHTSLTLWVRKVLPESISLTGLIGCASTEELPPLWFLL